MKKRLARIFIIPFLSTRLQVVNRIKMYLNFTHRGGTPRFIEVTVIFPFSLSLARARLMRHMHKRTEDLTRYIYVYSLYI